jgi:predicted transcriptional regulator
MTTQRIYVQLDSARKRKLKDMAERRCVSMSTVVREAIDRLYELELQDARRKAAQAIIAMQIEDFPDPADLKRQANEDTLL